MRRNSFKKSGVMLGTALFLQFAMSCQAASLSGKIDDALIAWWSFDESNGIIIDGSGSNHHGEAYGDPVTVPSPSDAALTFDGEDDYFEVYESNKLIFEGDFSIELWLKTDDGMPSTKPKAWAQSIYLTLTLRCRKQQIYGSAIM